MAESEKNRILEIEQGATKKIPDYIKSVLLGIKPVSSLDEKDVSSIDAILGSHEERSEIIIIGNYIINKNLTTRVIAGNKHFFPDYKEGCDLGEYIVSLDLNNTASLEADESVILLKNMQAGLLFGIPPEAIKQHCDFLLTKKKTGYNPNFDQLLRLIPKEDAFARNQMELFMNLYNKSGNRGFQLKIQGGEMLWNLFNKYMPPKNDEEKSILHRFLSSESYSVAGITWVQFTDNQELQIFRDRLKRQWESLNK
ncbi:hypothetical protein GYA54_01920 [Candidatus Kuenenbacteria bacterium]|nr:hypothetical protein [Candidatus Kuenenbacteria bacterium]